jgi:uncharacterized lipoprotein YddW (UPF0748 family)
MRDFELYRKLKITEVFLLAKGSDDYCFYNTEIGVKYPDYDWDILKTACEIASEFGISIHAWFCALTNPHLVERNPTFAMVDLYGGPANQWSNPIIPEVRNYILNMINEIITGYDVKGIHLDYIRFPGINFSYDDYSRAAFQSEYGFDPITNPSAPQWADWRRQQVTGLVNDAKTRLKNYNPNLKLSAAVGVPVIQAINWFYQNWIDWSNNRLVDFLCPMVYTTSVSEYETNVDYAVAYTAGRTEVLIGTGIYLYANYPNRKDIFLSQINITRKYKAGGWVLFRDEFLQPFVEYFPELEPKPDVTTQAIMAWFLTLCLPTLIPVISEYSIAVKEKAEELLGKLWSELRWEWE